MAETPTYLKLNEYNGQIPEVTKNECPHCGGRDCIINNRCEMPGCGLPVIYRVKEYVVKKLKPEEAARIAQMKIMKDMEYGTKRDPSKNELWGEIARLKQQLAEIQHGNPIAVHRSYEHLFGKEKLQTLGLAQAESPKTVPIPKKKANKLPEKGDPFGEF